eukprot:CAMPEP_0175043536 /NCGR_PEP_ID=MMETSP0052_2-20121109/3247_1 /TAXON_ID=51329 ORGANISM="Polytomella parva, Strain SAG 63-3" /NCGR_SAMPLE_ID=MMETSP0052_2 /ASSEMBLY_ACC=CAM_ASM_000194 /LENGTH=522 /DNA_ID=CAMNT_0016306617 /DNA_START=280 /DNA_END=1844 /DNA_ORIENTATION=+
MIVRYCPPSHRDDQSTFKNKHPRESYVEMIYPFSSNPNLRDLYRMFRYDKPRLGLLLEDFDTFAGDISIRHCGLPGRMLLTAAIDKISWLQAAAGVSDVDETTPPAHAHDREISLNHDLRVAGQVNWVGKTSMGVLLELSSLGDDHQWHGVGSARFVMVSRQLSDVKVPRVPDLIISTPRERYLYEDGQANAKLGRDRRSSLIRSHEPSAEELAELIRVMKATKKRTYAGVLRVNKSSPGVLPTARLGGGEPTGTGNGLGSDDRTRNNQEVSGTNERSPTPSSNNPTPAANNNEETVILSAVPMKKTQLLSAALMQHQDRNSYDVIFGGHLLSLAYEHASATAAIHTGRLCTALSMDDVTFRAPVPIGSLLHLKAKVIFVEGPVIRVHVTASIAVSELSPGESVLTNTFSFAFVNRRISPQESGPDFIVAPPVYPETLPEAMEYVAGLKRHMDDDASLRAVRKWEKQMKASTTRSSAVGGGAANDLRGGEQEKEAQSAEKAALKQVTQHQKTITEESRHRPS